MEIHEAGRGQEQDEHAEALQWFKQTRYKAPKQNDSNMRNNNTIKRLTMYNNGKSI